ncbi:MAG: metallophosphoesterase [Pirellulales bacterium]|nr:metallophosphoesterase [Pirellulales bacterium]
MNKHGTVRNSILGLSPVARCVVVLIVAVGSLVGYVGTAAAVDPFTVVLLPDTQHYTEMANDASNPYRVQTTWIANNMATENIEFVIHLGDIVQSKNTYLSQWQVADTAHDILDAASVPYSVMPGNHDMLGSGEPYYTRDATRYNEFFGPSRFAVQPWYGGHKGVTNESNYCLFSAGGMDFLVLSLELMARDATLDWANDVLDDFPDRRVIVATHKYLRVDGTRDTDTVYGDFTGNNANQVFDKLIKDHPNVFMVVCGHAHGEALHVATNTAGNPVYEVLGDYQDLEPDGGNGWLRKLQFSPDTNEILVSSYSPVLNQSNLWGQFVLPYDMEGVTPEPPEPTPASLVAHWALDDGQTNPYSTTAADATAPASNGTLANMSVPSAWVNGQFGKALDFDGTNDRVNMGATSELDLTEDLSMSFWIKPDGTGASKYGPLVGKNLSGGPSNDGYFTDIVYTASVTGAGAPAGTIEFAITNEGVNTVLRSSTALSLTDGSWHHVAVMYQAGVRMAIYLDGELDGELIAGVPEACAGTATAFGLGNLAADSTTDAYCFSGAMDDVWMFSGVLTPTQIARLLAGTSPFVPGDANSDGWIDEDDAAILAENWGATSASWGMGDFNNDHVVNAADASILAANWLPQGTTEGTAPEPSLLAMAGVAMAMIASRRRMH